MPRATPARDQYRRSREAATASRQNTRRKLLEAADELFLAQGYSATTVAAIAARAGVSLQTLYLAWGSKRALLRAASGAAAVAAAMPIEPEQWRARIDAELDSEAGRDPSGPAYVAAISRLWVRVAIRTAPYWRLHQQAAVTDAEVAADWAAITAERRETFAGVARNLPERGMRADLEADDVTTTLWTLASPETYQLFIVDGGQTPDAYEAWLTRTLTAALYLDELPEHA